MAKVVKKRTRHKRQIRSMIDDSKSLTELHSVWSRIKLLKLYEDELLMSWYDFKYHSLEI